MKPHDENNFLIEVTPEVKSELDQLYIRSDIDPVVELHYSPYWKRCEASKENMKGEEK